MSFANTEVLPSVAGYFRPIKGLDPYNKKSVDDSLKAANAAVKVLEDHLLVHTFLVGERITLADLFVAGILSRGFEFLFDKKWREGNPNVTRWYETVHNQPIYSTVVGELKFIDEALKNQAPKKEEKPKQEKAPKQPAAPKAKAKEKEPEDDEEEEDKPAPKPKHPLESLPKAALPLDEWKRKYSNEDTPVALKWFWENYNPEEYSLWRLDYKYNDELTQTFMTSNLIGKLHLGHLLTAITIVTVERWLTDMLQVDFSPVSKLHASTSSVARLSTVKPMTVLYKELSSFAVRKRSLLLTWRPTMTATLSRKSTFQNLKIRRL